MQINLYGHFLSTYTRVARLTLEEKGIGYSLNIVAPSAMKSPEHLMRHPFGKIPYLEHDGFWLYETRAIVEYVNEMFEGRALRPVDPRRIARMEQLISVVNCYVVPAWGGGIIRPRLIAPLLRGSVPDEAEIARDLPQAIFLVDDQVSFADLFLAPFYYSVCQTPEAAAVLHPQKALAGWWQRMSQRASIIATQPDFGSFVRPASTAS
jgi:glutathione S-transferase